MFDHDPTQDINPEDRRRLMVAGWTSIIVLATVSFVLGRLTK